jgi:hypothetical protein
MKAILPLFVFVDACGWEIIKDDPFVSDLAPHRRRLRSVFGYSSACIPSILSGQLPVEHRNWCYFVYDPKDSPFASLRWLRWFPNAFTGRRRVRRWLSKYVKMRLKFRGYFDLYNMPFRDIDQYNFTEKKSPLQPGGMNRGANIFDHLQDSGIPYHVSEPARGEQGNLEALLHDITAEQIDFAFLYWPDLDGLLHRVGNKSPEVPMKLRSYEKDIRRLMAIARGHYNDVRLYIFSDHGMANCYRHLDLRSRIQSLDLKAGRDYAVVYDSTMARFWFFNDKARQIITRELETLPQGKVMTDDELEKLGTLFPDRYFGELIFLAAEGVLIVPSHIGERPIRAMHGYHPDDPHSYAALLANRASIPADIKAIPDIFKLMLSEAKQAHAHNHPQAQPAATATAA